MKTAISKYGISGGLIVSILFLGPIVVFPEGYMDPEKMTMGAVIGYSVMILSMLCVFFGIKAYRNKHDDESFTFLKALSIGMQITVMANIIFYVANVLLYEVIAPDFLQEFGKFYKESLVNGDMDVETRSEILAEFEANAGVLENSYKYALVMAGTTFFIGIIISLISALVLKRNKPIAV